MKKELTPEQVIFLPTAKDLAAQKSLKRIKKSDSTLNKIKNALAIKKDGYNIYYVDMFSKDKLEELTEFLEKYYSKMDAPEDICYVSSEEDGKPEVFMLKNGQGKTLKEFVDYIKENYIECITEFYSTSSEGEKEDIIDKITEKRNSYIENLIDMAKKKKFNMKPTTNGFIFVPIKAEGENMTKEEYDKLENSEQDSIEKEAAILKKEAEIVLEKLKEIEFDSIERLKELYKDYLEYAMQENKNDFLNEFSDNDELCRHFLKMFCYLEKQLVDCYTMSLEDDEEYIQEALDKFMVNVLVDNTDIEHPRVIYEEDPTVSNLMGWIEYRTTSGGYSTDMSLINAGSILKANGGCLIVRLSSLLNNGASYYYLKKALIHGQADYNYTKNYLEVLSIAGLKPKPIPINLKVILIGDYMSHEILFEKDEDFKTVFPIKIEADSELKYTLEVKNNIKAMIDKKIKKDNLLEVTDDALNEIVKYLVRIAGNRKKISVDEYYVNRNLYLADNNAKLAGKTKIDSQDIINVAYEEEKIVNDFMENYTEGKTLMTVTGKKVGVVNALAVISTSSYSFGKPMRLTCLAVPGHGEIIDIHKEANMSGQIHQKSIGIIRGILSSIINPYEKLPVNIQLSFEQIYGMIDGDSASVAEIICVLSALSKKPVRQNIAVTGSINQLGEIQPIGGVNEKIEGFHRTCRLIDTADHKGVLIPASNADDLILSAEVEEDVRRGRFHIYTMENLNDAIETLILDGRQNINSFFRGLKDELEKYKGHNNEVKKKR